MDNKKVNKISKSLDIVVAESHKVCRVIQDVDAFNIKSEFVEELLKISSSVSKMLSLLKNEVTLNVKVTDEIDKLTAPVVIHEIRN